MNVDLNVIRSSAINRKKSWSRTFWIGKQKEELLLVDKRRLSFLNLLSGNTTKKVGAIHSHLQEAACIAISRDGLKLGVLLYSGDILLWDKDSNSLSKVQGIPELASSKGNGSVNQTLFIGHNMQQVIVNIHNNQAYIWTSSESQEIKKHGELSGNWVVLPTDPNIALPLPENQEAISEFGYISDFGGTIFITYIFSLVNCICVSICQITPHVTLRMLKNQKPTMKVTWKCLKIIDREFHPDFLVLKKKGAYIGSISNCGSMLALAANQYASHLSQIAFVSLESMVFQKVDLMNSGVPKIIAFQNRQNWLCQLCWTQDNCFLLGISRSGSMVMTTRLGQGLLSLNLQGCSMDRGPALWLNVFPFVSPVKIPVLKLPSKVTSEINKGTDNDNISIVSSSSLSEHSSTLRQRFSLSTHSGSSVITVSDGYLVILLDLPNNLTGLLPTTHTILAHAQHALRLVTSKTLPVMTPGHYSSHPTEHSISSNASKNNSQSPPSGEKRWEALHLEQSLKGLQDAWALLVSNRQSWDSKMDHTTQQVVLLLCRALYICLSAGLENFQDLFHSLHQCFKLLYFDSTQHQLLPSSFKLINLCVETALETLQTEAALKRIQIFESLWELILAAEECIQESYTYSLLVTKEFSEEVEYLSGDCYCPSRDVTGYFTSSLIEKCSKKAWKLLYSQVVSLYTTVLSSPVCKEDLVEHCQDLLCQVQGSVQHKGWDLCSVLNPPKRARKNKNIIQYLTGHTSQCMKHWIAQIAGTISQPSSKLLHRVLYAFCQQGEWSAALTFVTSLLAGNFELFQEDSKKSKNTYSGIVIQATRALNVKAIASLVTSFSRIFVAYFVKNPVLIYPVHSPRPMLSSLTNNAECEWRAIVLLSACVCWQLSCQGLESLLTPSLTLEGLALTGRWQEAVTFALHLGRWREAWVLSSLCSLLPWKRKVIGVPEANDIIFPKLKEMLHLDEQEEKSGIADNCVEEAVGGSSRKLGEVLLGPLLVSPHLDPVPLLLSSLVGKLASLVASAPVLVPLDIYLPTPPLYCPPQSIGYEAGDVPARESEEGLRVNVALTLEQVRCLLQAAHLGVPLLAWYLQFLQKLWKDMDQELQSSSSLRNLLELCRNCSDLSMGEDPSWTPKEWFLPQKEQQGALECLQSLRTLCGLLWCLTCRDHLALAFRELQQFTLTTSLISGHKDPYSTQHLHMCYQVLHYICFMLPFQTFLSSRDSLALMFLNVALEIPPTKELAKLVAQLMIYFDKPSMNVERRHSELIQKWETQECDVFSDARTSKSKVKLAKPRSLIKGEKEPHTKISSSFPNATTWNTVYDSCFEEQKGALVIQNEKYARCLSTFSNVGVLCEDYRSCSFELEVFFLEFLVPFFQIGVLKNEALEPAPPQVPLLRAYVDILRETHISNFYDSVKYLQKQENLETTRVSFLDLSASSEKLQAETFRFGSSSRRKSILFCRKTSIFCSPSKNAVDKFEKLVIRVQKHKSKRGKTSNAKRRWKSLSNLLSAQDMFSMLTRSSIGLNLSLSPKKFQPRAKSAQDVSSLAAILRTNGAEDFINCYAWLHLWLVNSNTDLICKPSSFLLSFAREIYHDHPHNLVKLLENSSHDNGNNKHTKIHNGKTAFPLKKTVTFSPEHTKQLESCLNGSLLCQVNQEKVVRDLSKENERLIADEGEVFATTTNAEIDHNPQQTNKMDYIICSNDSTCNRNFCINNEIVAIPTIVNKAIQMSADQPSSTMAAQLNLESGIELLQANDPEDKIGNILKSLKKSVEFITYANSDFSSNDSQRSGQKSEPLAPVEIPRRRTSQAHFFEIDAKTLPNSPVSKKQLVARKYSLPPMNMDSWHQISSCSSNSSETKVHPEFTSQDQSMVYESKTSESIAGVSNKNNYIQPILQNTSEFDSIGFYSIPSPKFSSSSISESGKHMKNVDFASLTYLSSSNLPDFREGSISLSSKTPVQLCGQMQKSCTDSSSQRIKSTGFAECNHGQSSHFRMKTTGMQASEPPASQDDNNRLTTLVQNILQSEIHGIVDKLVSKPSNFELQYPRQKEGNRNKNDLVTSSTQTYIIPNDCLANPSTQSIVYNSSILNQSPTAKKNITKRPKSVLDEITLLNMNPDYPSWMFDKLKSRTFSNSTRNNSSVTETKALSLPMLKVDVSTQKYDKPFTMFSPEKITALLKKNQVELQVPELDLNHVKKFLELQKNKRSSIYLTPPTLLKLNSEVKRVNTIQTEKKLTQTIKLAHLLPNLQKEDTLQMASIKEKELKNSFSQTEIVQPFSLSQDFRSRMIPEEQNYAELQYKVYSMLQEKEKVSNGAKTIYKDAETSTEVDSLRRIVGILTTEMQTESIVDSQPMKIEPIKSVTSETQSTLFAEIQPIGTKINASHQPTDNEKLVIKDSLQGNMRTETATTETQTTSFEDIQPTEIEHLIVNKSLGAITNEQFVIKDSNQKNISSHSQIDSRKMAEIPDKSELNLIDSPTKKLEAHLEESGEYSAQNVKPKFDVQKKVDSNYTGISELKEMLANRKPLQNKTNLKRDLCERLNTMQKQLDVIENISVNVQKDFSSTQQVLKDLESSSSMTDSHRKNRNFSLKADGEEELFGDGYSNWIANLPYELQSDSKSLSQRSSLKPLNTKSFIESSDPITESTLNHTQTLERGRRRISFGATETILVPKIDEFEKTFRIVPFEKEDTEPNERDRMDPRNVPPLPEDALQKMYKIYGSKRLPTKVLENLQIKQLNQGTKERMPDSDGDSDSLSSWEVPKEVQRILYGETSKRSALI